MCLVRSSRCETKRGVLEANVRAVRGAALTLRPAFSAATLATEDAPAAAPDAPVKCVLPLAAVVADLGHDTESPASAGM